MHQQVIYCDKIEFNNFKVYNDDARVDEFDGQRPFTL